MKRLILSAGLAIVFGIGLACFETLVNWGQWQWWPFWMVDYVAAALLIVGGLATFKQFKLGSKLLCSGWGFTLGMLWMSLAGNISNGTDPNRAARVADLYIALIIFSIVLALIGLLLALTKEEKLEA